VGDALKKRKTRTVPVGDVWWHNRVEDASDRMKKKNTPYGRDAKVAYTPSWAIENAKGTSEYISGGRIRFKPRRRPRMSFPGIPEEIR